jgi:hypothetical protein
MSNEFRSLYWMMIRYRARYYKVLGHLYFDSPVTVRSISSFDTSWLSKYLCWRANG